jgi:hypothetical protein
LRGGGALVTRITVGLFAAALLAVTSTGCGGCRGGGPMTMQDILGTWQRPGGSLLSFRRDGDFALQIGGENGRVVRGKFAVHADRLTFRSDPRSSECAGVTGVYRTVYRSAQLRLTPVSDDCASRSQQLRADWRRR